MISKIQGSTVLAQYSFDVSISKRRSGEVALFGTLGQIQGISNTLDSQSISNNSVGENFNLGKFTSHVEVVWRLNANPLVRIIVVLPLDRFASLVDFVGFSKNNIVGVRFKKEQLGQSSSWLYGVTQYQIPRLEESRRNVLVEGYGLLFEAARRQTSRNFKNVTAIGIITIIVQKYNVQLKIIGDLSDRTVSGAEQYQSDFDLLNRMASILDAYWYLDEGNFVLISRSFMYKQTPEITLSFGNQISDNLSNVFPISEFTPLLDASCFEAGATLLRTGGIDLDTGEVVKKDFSPIASRLGPLALNSSQFLSDQGVVINDIVLRPAPNLKSDEAGVILPLKTRSNDAFIYQYSVDDKDLGIRAQVMCTGIPVLKPGMVVLLSGVGDTFGGNWIVEEVHHVISEEKNFTTVLTLVRNALGQTNSPVQFAVNTKSIESQPDSTVKKFAKVTP
jgi:hypothetical protein